jgi:hypothetical protein
VPFSGDEITSFEIVNIAPDFNNPAHKLVTYGHGDRNGLLGPLIPVVDVNVRAADRRLVNLDEDVIDSRFRDWNFFKPEAWLPSGFDQRFHGFHEFSPLMGALSSIRVVDLLVKSTRIVAGLVLGVSENWTKNFSGEGASHLSPSFPLLIKTIFCGI